MAQGDFLKLVYNDSNIRKMILKETGKAVSDARSRGSNWVEYRDGHGSIVATADEVAVPYSYPYVEIKGGPLNTKIGTASIHTNSFLNPDGKVEFSTYGGTIGTSNYDSDTLKKFHPEYNTGDTGGSQSINDTPSKNEPPGGSGTYSHSGPISLSKEGEAFSALTLGTGVAGVLFSICIGILLMFFGSHMYNIYRYTYMACIYASCPIMVVLFLLICRLGKNPSKEKRVFRLIHLILFIAGFLFLAYVNYCIFYGRPIPFLVRIVASDSWVLGMLHFMVGFAPMAVYGIISGIASWVMKKSPDYDVFSAISINSTMLMAYGSVFWIACTQLVTEFNKGVGFFEALIIPIALALYFAIASVISMLIPGLIQYWRK